MLDLSPSADPPQPTSPTSPRSPLISTSPTMQYFPIGRRQSSSVLPTTSLPANHFPHLSPSATTTTATAADTPTTNPISGFPAPGGLPRDALGLAGAFPLNPPRPVHTLASAPARRASSSSLRPTVPAPHTDTQTPCDVPEEVGSGALAAAGAGAGASREPISPHAAMRKRRESSSKLPPPPEFPREATIRGVSCYGDDNEGVCFVDVRCAMCGVAKLDS